MTNERRHSQASAIFCVLAGAALYFVSTGLRPVWVLTWLAPIPVLAFAFKASGKAAALGAFLAFLLGELNMLSYFLKLMPAGAVIPVLIFPASVFALAVLFVRRFALRAHPWLAFLAFPVAWTSYEFLFSLMSPHGTAISLAYTQMNFLPLIQIASVAGIWGISFLLSLVPSGIVAAWHFRNEKKRAIPILAATFSAIALVLCFGWIRLAEPGLQPTIRVGLASTDLTIRCFRTEKREDAIPVLEAYARRAGELAAKGAAVVVLPEKFTGVASGYAEEANRILSDAARSNKITVIAGLNRVGRPDKRNAAVVFSPEGGVVIEYEKVHFVPGLEWGYRSAKQPGIFELSGIRAGTAVCKDMDFPEWARRYGRAGVRVMFVPAWDFSVDARWHGRMAVLRGVENGFAVARSAQEGLLTVSDSRGRIIAEDSSSRAPDVLLIVDVAPGSGHTLYDRIGDLFGWLNAACLVAGLVLLFVRR